MWVNRIKVKFENCVLVFSNDDRQIFALTSSVNTGVRNNTHIKYFSILMEKYATLGKLILLFYCCIASQSKYNVVINIWYCITQKHRKCGFCTHCIIFGAIFIKNLKPILTFMKVDLINKALFFVKL